MVLDSESAEVLEQVKVQLHGEVKKCGAAKALGTQYFLENKMQVATLCYKHAVGCADTSDNDRIVIFGNLAQCELRLGHPKEALEWCEKALEVQPRNVKNLNRKGAALEILNDLSGARKCYEKALSECTEEHAKLKQEIQKKLHKVVGSLEAQRQIELAKVVQAQRKRDLEIERSRPVLSCGYPAHCQDAGVLGIQKVPSPYVYQEKDWTPWIRQKLRRRCEADPESDERLKVYHVPRLCMALLPETLPEFGPSREMQLYMQKVHRGEAMMGEGMPPLPPKGKELQDKLAETLATGYAMFCKRGLEHKGISYDLQLVIFWRAIEKQADESVAKCEGCIVLHACDDEDPKTWKMEVSPLPPDYGGGHQLPEGQVLELLLKDARALGDCLKGYLLDLLQQIEASGTA
eukprot:gnl/MRDRNA2_/MRDRNA2_14377_c0_seq1.p1 gnl/MRDRNA2_/MRDRNA2_14377_c0~~gnl/MRDRNA2_/MRDRNA2_14377_c0_seq1.p1  ORF type:complete len:405 (+),score=95.36 gnl/MRDRNA2_/MRDRNA2_14377_c0_seq1:69-1283(+)